MSHRIYLLPTLAPRVNMWPRNVQWEYFIPLNHSDWLRNGHMTQVRPMRVKPRTVPSNTGKVLFHPLLTSPLLSLAEEHGSSRRQSSWQNPVSVWSQHRKAKPRHGKKKTSELISLWASGSSHAWILPHQNWHHQFLMKFKTQFLSSRGWWLNSELINMFNLYQT